MVDQYIFTGSLPEKAITYIIREADNELYERLISGKFCYVFNARQSGKSSLRVQIMHRLRDAGIECATINLAAGGVQNVTEEQWYAGLIDTLIESFALNVDLGEWWEKNRLHSPLTRFRKFIEYELLIAIKNNIVIFIEEIDNILNLKFPTDDFFTFIRACYTQRVDNHKYHRLTFCLLGVVSQDDLMSDKKLAPFNIGYAIDIKGFQLHEMEPLISLLRGKVTAPKAVTKEILSWTGGQPFLTQKLYQFMLEEFEKAIPSSVEEIVRSRIIENWEFQDNPEHLRTIKRRLLNGEAQNSQRLLSIWQNFLHLGKVDFDSSREQTELLLTGLVVNEKSKLKIYNPIYEIVFNHKWCERELEKLQPVTYYSIPGIIDIDVITRYKLNGRGYSVKDILGIGGFGITYLVEDRNNNNDKCVIKTIKSELIQSARSSVNSVEKLIKLISTFRKEAKTLLSCEHCNIVKIKGMFSEKINIIGTELELLFILMEYIEGENLAQRINRLGILSELEALQYIQQVSQALAFVHNQGLLHRDIKPQNIMVCKASNKAVLIDFGFARDFDPDVSQSHSVAYTPGYAPPEQHRTRARCRECTDIYALAATLYYLLTKREPIHFLKREHGERLIEPQEINSGISDSVNQAIIRGMELDLNQRPQTVEEWLSALG